MSERITKSSKQKNLIKAKLKESGDRQKNISCVLELLYDCMNEQLFK